MKAELRLGNHVYISPKDSPDWLIPSILNTGNFIAILRGLTVATPVPLTPEILAKAGLKERYAKGEWSWAACKAEGQWDSYTEIVEKPDGYKYVGSNYPLIKYLHQLQNLYFALTGEELIIQL